MGDTVDLAAIIAPAAQVPLLIEACGLAGVRAIVLFSEGFRDAGSSGARIERAMLDVARRYRVRIIGPRSFGLFCPRLGLNLTPKMCIRDSQWELECFINGSLCL